MSKKSFYNLLEKYQNGNCIEAERQLVEQWYDMLGTQNTNQLSEEELNNIHSRIWLKIKPVKTKKLTSRKFIRVAASISIVLILGLLYLKKTEDPEITFIRSVDYAGLINKTNTGLNTLDIVLPDKSLVSLNPGASINYPQKFLSNYREVYINGNAFLKITENKAKPFLVHNRELTVKVWGTSFYVNQGDGNHDDEVLVKTGKVEVCENYRTLKLYKQKSIFVTANQKASFSKKDQKITASIIKNPIPLYQAYNRPQPADYVDKQKFYDTPLNSVFKSISKNYGIDIKLDNEDLKKCTFTGDISGKTMKDQLLLVCATIAGYYTIDGTTILIKGTPCN